ncbi:MAG TPA: hypothetical protein VLE93_02830 [Candidatus Saccharimonadales bacterium]|nr:hypothetical protein [Candidatus Saccharimonadales bacterium]
MGEGLNYTPENATDEQPIGFTDPDARQYEADVKESQEETLQKITAINDEANLLLPSKFPNFVTWKRDNVAQMQEDLSNYLAYRGQLPKLTELFEQRESLKDKRDYLEQQSQHIDPHHLGPHIDEPKLPKEGV